MPQDRIQSQFEVGQVVNIPIVVTGIGGTPAAPTITGTTKLAGYAGTFTAITTVDCIQVIKDK